MPYSVIQPPFTLEFHKMSKAELKSYYKWFHQVLPERIDELAAAVRRTPDFDRWKPDYTRASLDQLGKWLAIQVDVRPRSADEIAKLTLSSPYAIDFSDWELTNRTFSLAFDSGMYLGEMLRANCPSLYWTQVLGSKNFVDYGQPVLMGFRDAIPMNPVQIAVALMYGLAKKKRDGQGLEELYRIWIDQAGEGRSNRSTRRS